MRKKHITILLQRQVPRLSAGPDVVQNVVLGSEGCYGLITEVTLKVFRMPALRRFGSIVFPDFEKSVTICSLYIIYLPYFRPFQSTPSISINYQAKNNNFKKWFLIFYI